MSMVPTVIRVVVLKSVPYGRQWRSNGTLPYRIDLLARHGYCVVWTDPPSSPVLTRLESIAVPFRQAWLTRRDRRTARAVVAMFESEGHGLALTRLITRHRRPPLVVIACWLADLAVRSRQRRLLYRRLYRAVDAVVVFSTNQVDVLTDVLDIDRARVHVVRFGVDLDELDRMTTSERGADVVAVGRDRARDWRTLAGASLGARWTVDLVDTTGATSRDRTPPRDPRVTAGQPPGLSAHSLLAPESSSFRPKCGSTRRGNRSFSKRWPSARRAS